MRVPQHQPQSTRPNCTEPPPRWTRRQFAALSATACSAAAFAKSAANFRLRYIVGSPMYGTAELAKVLAELPKTGTDTIDIWPRKHANHREQIDKLGLDRVERLLSEHGAKIGMVTRYDLGPFRVTEEIPLLKRFGGELVVCGAHAQAGDDLKERVTRFVRSLDPHVAKFEDAGIRLGIENHSGTLLSSVDGIKYFAEAATSPSLGLAMAPYHLPQDPQLIANLIRTLNDKLVFFQAWQHGNGCMKKLPKEQEMLQMAGRGPLDFGPILAALRDINYQGWTEIFMHPVPRGIPIRDTISEVTDEINHARAYLDGLL